jgi:hypothetical protein
VDFGKFGASFGESPEEFGGGGDGETRERFLEVDGVLGAVLFAVKDAVDVEEDVFLRNLGAAQLTETDKDEVADSIAASELGRSIEEAHLFCLVVLFVEVEGEALCAAIGVEVSQDVCEETGEVLGAADCGHADEEILMLGGGKEFGKLIGAVIE